VCYRIIRNPEDLLELTPIVHPRQLCFEPKVEEESPSIIGPQKSRSDHKQEYMIDIKVTKKPGIKRKAHL
jgi:hypothetical protein